MRPRRYQLWNITIEMLGKRSSPVLAAKASESRHALDFAVVLLERHAASLDPLVQKCLLASGKAAQEVNEIIRTSPRIMSEAQQQALLHAYIRHTAMYVRGGGHLVPKHHLMIHCIQRIKHLGNPRFYHTYRDESLNGIVVRIAKTAHRLTFMHTVHRKFRMLSLLGITPAMF